MTSQGFSIFTHPGARTRLELRCRTDGEALISDIKAAPVIPGSPETDLLFSQGFQPLWVDLGDVGLASGLQLWVKQDIKPRDVETMLLQDKLASSRCAPCETLPMSSKLADAHVTFELGTGYVLVCFIALQHLHATPSARYRHAAADKDAGTVIVVLSMCAQMATQFSSVVIFA